MIGDTAFKVIRGADVYVVGTGRRTQTDSAGSFHLPIEPGSYMVQVTSPGFARRLLSVTIPADSGRHITVWMAPAGRRANYRDAVAVEGLRHRFTMRRSTARFFTREELNRLNTEWLKPVVVMGSGMPIPDDCDVVIDGLWTRPVYSFALDEIESVEVYPLGSLPSLGGSMRRTTPPRSIDPRGTQPVRSGLACPQVFVWTRH